MRILFFAALLLVGCGNATPSGDGGADSGGESSFARVQSIFTRSCATSFSCHGAGAPSGLVLTDGLAYQNLVGVTSAAAPRLQRVVAGSPAQSFLFLKVEGTHQTAFCPMLPGCGSRMPMVGGVVLSAEELAAIRTWIAEGAPR